MKKQIKKWIIISVVIILIAFIFFMFYKFHIFQTGLPTSSISVEPGIVEEIVNNSIGG